MIDTILFPIPLTIPILKAERTEAYKVSKQLPQEQREQHYQNVLVATVVQRCLKMLGVLSQQNTRHACLYIPEVQKHLWCYQDDRQWVIPKSDDCVGVVVVQLDSEYRKGQVLGFVPAGSSDLQPLDVLIDCLFAPQPQPVQLGKWLKQIFEPDWPLLDTLLHLPKKPILTFASASPKLETIEELVNQLYLKQSANARSAPTDVEPLTALVQLIQTTQNDEIRWQAGELLWKLDPQHSASPIIKAKDLGLYLAGHAIALMVGILPLSDSKVLILLRVYPIDRPHLPAGLKLVILDETGNPFQELKSRQHDDYIQFKLTADIGDRFSVQVVLNDASFTESLVV